MVQPVLRSQEGRGSRCRQSGTPPFRTLRTCADLVWCGGCLLDRSRCEADDNERFRVARVTNRQLSLMIAVVEDKEGLRVALGRLLRAAG